MFKVSLFGDGRFDWYLAFGPFSKQPPHLNRIERYILTLVRYQIEDRRTWIYRWINRLLDWVAREAAFGNSRFGQAVRHARTAFSYMAACLLVRREPVPLDAKGSSIQTEAIRNLSTKCPLRFRFTEDLINAGLRDLSQLEELRTTTQLAGPLGHATAATAKVAVELATPNARLLIRGSPGGGKGVTAQEAHRLFMLRVIEGLRHVDPPKKARNPKDEKVVTRSYYDWLADMRSRGSGGLPSASAGPPGHGRGAGTGAADADRLPLWPNYLREIVRRLCDLSYIAAYMTPSESHEFLRLQVAPTRWLNWNCEGCASDHSCGCSRPLACDLFRQFAGDHTGNPSDDCDIRIFYFCRFMRQMYRLCDTESATQHKNSLFNFMQITCGSLGDEGAELIQSLRQLFGYAGSRDRWRYAYPGLFQICSYMGGTLFLDEIADAPMRIQDNLLRPLEEGKVVREGWETFPEDVSNIRIVAATHKDLRQAARLYHETKYSPRPAGLRPDIISRIAVSEPVSVFSIMEYFQWDKERDNRDAFRNGFCDILGQVIERKRERISTHIDEDERKRFCQRVYDVVDEKIRKAAASGLDPRLTDETEAERIRLLCERISMRFFVDLAGRFCEAFCDGNNHDAIVARLLDEHVAPMVDYLLSQ